MQEQTLVIIKPDAITRWLSWEIMKRFEKKWLKLVACKMVSLDESVLEEHYKHLKDKPFFPSIVSYMTSSPVMLQVWEWVEVIDVVRLMIWVTNSRQAQPWTIRWDFAMSIGRNIVHASEDKDAAQEEIARFFSEEEISSYERADEMKIYESDELWK